MAEGQQPKGVPAWLMDEHALAWMDEHATGLRRHVAGQHFLYWSLAIGLVIGLAAQVGGYVLQASLPTGLPGLLGDLLHALGWSLWTGAVVFVFIEVIPEVKRRQIRQALDAYEAVRRDKTNAAGNREGTV